MIVYYEDIFINYIIVNSCEIFYNVDKSPIDKIYNLNIPEADKFEEIYILLFSELNEDFYKKFSEKNIKIIDRSGHERENILNWQLFWIEAKENVIERYRFNVDILNKLILTNDKHNRAIQEFCNYIYKNNKEVLNKFDISEECAYRQGYSLLKIQNDSYKEQRKNAFIYDGTIFIMGTNLEYIYNIIAENQFNNIYLFNPSFNIITVYGYIKTHTIPFPTKLKKYNIEETQINLKDFYNILSIFFKKEKKLIK